MVTKLYVGNLSFDTSEMDVRDLFSQAGDVQTVEMINDRMTGRPRGFGFVTMADAEGARTAVDQLDGKSFQGRNLSVNEARDRESSPRSGGGGYGGGNSNSGDRDRRPARRY